MSETESNEVDFPLATICHFCVFKETENEVQTGCEFDRVDRFIAQGAGVTAEEIGGITGYKLHGRLCNLCRTDESFPKGTLPSEYAEIAHKDARIRVDFVVFYGPDQTFDDLVRTFDSIADQTMNGLKVTVVILRNDYSNYLLNKMVSSSGLKFPYELSFPDVKNTSREIAIRDAFDRCKGNYLSYSTAGYEYESDFVEWFETKINFDLEQIMIAAPEEGYEGCFASRSVLRSYEYDFEALKQL